MESGDISGLNILAEIHTTTFSCDSLWYVVKRIGEELFIGRVRNRIQRFKKRWEILQTERLRGRIISETKRLMMDLFYYGRLEELATLINRLGFTIQVDNEEERRIMLLISNYEYKLGYRPDQEIVIFGVGEKSFVGETLLRVLACVERGGRYHLIEYHVYEIEGEQVILGPGGLLNHDATIGYLSSFDPYYRLNKKNIMSLKGLKARLKHCIHWQEQRFFELGIS